MDVVTEDVYEGLMEEILYADDMVLIRDTIDDIKANFLRWKDALERKGLKVNLGKTKFMVSRSKDERCCSKINRYGICGKRVVSNSVVCRNVENTVVYKLIASICKIIFYS